MSNVISGGVSSLPGAIRNPPQGQVCDEHPQRLAVSRIQGETDSMGCEEIDMCQSCFDVWKAYRSSDQAVEDSKGSCERCRAFAPLFNKRDWEEGSSGRLYQICAGCVTLWNKQEREEFADEDARNDDFYDYSGED